MSRDARLADMMSAAEALLFVSDESVSAQTLAEMVGVGPIEMSEALAALASEYADENRGIQLREVAGGWRLFTHPAHHELIERYVLSWDTRRLSQAALEALAVIAYHQPVTRAGINAVRGVNSEAVISSLIEKGLVRELGRDKNAGGAILYGTTRSFLEKFGLKSIKDLPPLEDYAPDEASRQLIRERLSATPLFGVEGQTMLDELEDDVKSVRHRRAASAEEAVSAYVDTADEGSLTTASAAPSPVRDNGPQTRHPEQRSPEGRGASSKDPLQSASRSDVPSLPAEAPDA